MANEFIARNGLIAQQNSTITGSLIVTGGITGSLLGTASYATQAATATNVSGISSNIMNNGGTYLVTATGGETLQGESNLTWNGSLLSIGGSVVQTAFGSTVENDNTHAEGNTTVARGVHSHTEGESTATGTNYAFYSGNIVGGVITVNAYGDLTPIIGVGNLLLFDDSNFNNTYGKTSFRIASASWDGSKTYITLTDATVSTTEVIFGDPIFYDYWSTYGGDQAIHGTASHAEGYGGNILGNYSHTEGKSSRAYGEFSHAEGNNTATYGENSHAEGSATRAEGLTSHAEGYQSTAIGVGSHAEGRYTRTGAFGYNSTSIVSGVIILDAGYGNVKPYLNEVSFITLSDTDLSNTYGTQIFEIAGIDGTTPTTIFLVDTSVNTPQAYIGSPGTYQHPGADRVIPTAYSHTEGIETSTVGRYSHAEGYATQPAGLSSHTEGLGTVTVGSYQHASGMYNQPVAGDGVFMVGNGTGVGSRTNLLVASGSKVSVYGSLDALSITGSLLGTATGAITASYAVSSSRAVTASYALNGGVTQIMAGTNVTISPTNGLGTVTINASGGGGGGGSTPVKLTSQTILSASWVASGGYYTSSFANSNITTTCDISVTPQPGSYLTAYNAQILPYVGVATGTGSFYSNFPPAANMVVDIVITQTT